MASSASFYISVVSVRFLIVSAGSLIASAHFLIASADSLMLFFSLLKVCRDKFRGFVRTFADLSGRVVHFLHKSVSVPLKRYLAIPVLWLLCFLCIFASQMKETEAKERKRCAKVTSTRCYRTFSSHSEVRIPNWIPNT